MSVDSIQVLTSTSSTQTESNEHAFIDVLRVNSPIILGELDIISKKHNLSVPRNEEKKTKNSENNSDRKKIHKSLNKIGFAYAITLAWK